MGDDEDVLLVPVVLARELRRPLFDWNSFTAYKYIFRAMMRSNKLARRRKYSYIRDVFKAWNLDWKTESKTS